MCGICGCHESHELEHSEQGIQTTHQHAEPKLIEIEENILAKNNQFALSNRNYLQQNNITALNIMSSPGAGKTTLLGKTITDLKHRLDMSVIVADQQTDYDASIIRASGARAIQVNTGRVCHLDAHMVGHSLESLQLQERSLLFIENIGNLVCPALFDLGETYKVVILSVTEGDNKPLKYPDMFRNADLLLLTKTDLLPYVEFDCHRCSQYVQKINSDITIMKLSATSGDGLAPWYQWLMDIH
ncbi:hydrogenase nickel incorporation protein HypB [Legionella oakridgensis]|uniref:Hydrogenase maturation factor HypB n=2 Tax=Legionella oakridgensis TaxID=29423 RepID=W0BH28_9GAMM|nr:hydrogenase nickel incorporation protein HypB [Legionella oakridgensis]AHE68026.1 hydrogenase accessory protein HypB [Legionella oakridgensis ATCC 33761 = DSM 21215]ETO92454.1 hydrogenase nickel incorporation protein HypB [Legionella oakridgensis RV-2-2007]KTD44574.1 hydrogenase expression/formation protein HypB [Legionella oakridgensis]STY21015.1 hydrogenase expression/formation protein HypB [Legionella longbeachae]